MTLVELLSSKLAPALDMGVRRRVCGRRQEVFLVSHQLTVPQSWAYRVLTQPTVSPPYQQLTLLRRSINSYAGSLLADLS